VLRSLLQPPSILFGIVCLFFARFLYNQGVYIDKCARVEYIVSFSGRAPKRCSKKKRSNVHHYFCFNHDILQHRKPASLKTFSPTQYPKRNRALQIQCMFTWIVLYLLPSKRKNTAAAQRSTGLAHLCLTSFPLAGKLLLELLQ
jgi:hypothetical protein